MSKVQEYLRLKKIKELGLPKLYVVKSTREGVKNPVEHQVVEIKKGVAFQGNERLPIDRYKIEDAPYEVDILRGETSVREYGYASGFGDLWYWTNFCSFSKEDAEQFFQEESERVRDKYLKPEETLVELLERRFVTADGVIIWNEQVKALINKATNDDIYTK